MIAHEHDPDQRPDSDYEPGRLTHLVADNEGRSLDSRRTCFRVVSVNPKTGMVTLEILTFEDAGAMWEISAEDLTNATKYQFERGSATAPAADVAALERAIDRFDRETHVAADPAVGVATERRIDALAEEADSAVSVESIDLTTRTGSVALAEQFRSYMKAQGLLGIEIAFAEQYVRNPNSGELVKGHRIVVAELGLVGYRGKVLRTPDVFDGMWCKQRRAAHVCHRMAFVRAAYRRCGLDRVMLYRGLYLDGPLEPTTDDTFVSASFDFDVARSCMGEIDPNAAGILWRQPVDVRRVLMTYAETREMNLHYKEAEAVLLNNPGPALF